jgi:hypothetical protein
MWWSLSAFLELLFNQVFLSPQRQQGRTEALAGAAG